MDPNERQQRLQALQAMMIQGEMARQQIERMALEDAQVQQAGPQAPSMNTFQQQSMSMPGYQQPGPGLFPGVNGNGQLNAQGQMQVQGANSTHMNQVQPYGWPGYAQLPQTQAAAIYPPNQPQPPAASTSRSHSNPVGPGNLNSVAQAPQAPTPKRQGRAPSQSSNASRNPLQEQLDAMAQAYARNAIAAYVSPGTDSSSTPSSQRNTRPQSKGAPPSHVLGGTQQPHYRPHVYKPTSSVAVPSQDSSIAQDQAQVQTQRSSTASSPPISPQSNDAGRPQHQVARIPSVPKLPTVAPLQQSLPQPKRLPPRPASNPSVSAPAPPPSGERVVDIPSWSTSLVNRFKQQCFSYFQNAPTGTTMDVYENFQFARGFVLQKQFDGVWMVDTRDNMKAPFIGLINELESRQVPDNAAGGMRSFGGAVANTVQAARAVPPGKVASTDQVTALNAIKIGVEQQQPVGVQAQPLRAPTPQTRGTPSAPVPSVLARSPADADRRTLAKDILYALGKRARPAGEAEAGPDPKRNAPSMSVFSVQQPWSVLPDRGGIIDLSQLPVLPAAPPKPYNPPFARVTSFPSRPSMSNSSTSVPAPPPPPAKLAIAAGVSVAPSAVVSSPRPLLQAPQPRSAVSDRLHDALLTRPVKESDVSTSQPLASSSSNGSLQVATSPSLPPIATINDPGPSPDVVTPTAARVPSRQEGGSGRDSTPQLVTGQSEKKGKGRARSVASDAASLLPPSRASSKASRVPPTSPSPGTSAVVDLTSPSPQVVSRAESEGEPLFLPSGSPPQSPNIGDYSLFTPERPMPGKSQRKQQVYVAIPPPSPRTLQFMERCRQKSGRPESSRAPTSGGRSSSRATSTVVGGRTNNKRSSSRATSTVAGRVDNVPLPAYVEGEDVEYDYSFDQHGNVIEDLAERRLMELAFTRMQPVECKWDRCDFVANSAMSLLTHYKKHHRPAPSKNGAPDRFSCLWTQCGKQCRYQEIRHFIKHALDSLTCPYADCEDRFRNVGKLRRHVEKHAAGSRLKPGCTPFRPLDLAPPRPSPATLPAYLTATPLVFPAAIGPARHAKLLPWVKKGASGLAKRGQPRPARTAARKQGEGTLHEPQIDRNEDLIDYTTRYSSYVSEPANIKAANIEEPEVISRLSMAGRVSILNDGTDAATIEWLDEVKEEERSPTPQQPDPLLLRSQSREPPPPPTIEVLSSDTEEVEEDQLAWDTGSQEGEDSEVEAMLL